MHTSKRVLGIIPNPINNKIIILLEGLLNAYMKFHPLSLPELHYIVEHYGSPTFSKRDNTNLREKGGVTSILDNKKKKKKKDAVLADKTDGKLRQPTIIDVLKRAGAVPSQEVSSVNCSGSSCGRNTSPCCQPEVVGSSELGHVDISEKPSFLESQRFKFRPLLVDCFAMLGFFESRDSCCSDPSAELPLHLYLLRDFHAKLEYLNASSKHNISPFSVKILAGYCRMTIAEFLERVRPFFTSLKKHLDCALSFLKDGSETCQNHWQSQSLSAGNPDVPYIVVSKSSVATSVCAEVLSCFRKLLSLPDLYLQTNLPVLRDMLEAFQPIEKLDQFLSDNQPLPTPGSIEYLYYGAYSFFESIRDIACLFSFTLASEVLITLESVVNSITMLIGKSIDGNDKPTDAVYSRRLVNVLRSRLALSSRKLLLHDPGKDDSEKVPKNKGVMIQKILQIYLSYSESTSDLLDELACSVLPQVPSCRAVNTEAVHGFPTLCPTMFLTWYRVLHEENLSILNKTVKEVKGKSRKYMRGEAAQELLKKLRQTVNVVVSLISLCKVHDKVAVHAMAVKYGGKYVDSFLKVFDFLQENFQAHNDLIIQTVKELQRATRTIQTLCSEAKGLKITRVTSKVPATKRSMERFLFHVKALLHSTSSNCTFWMGNLKHKDLSGHVVSSQIYNNGEDDMVQEENNQIEDEDEEKSINGVQSPIKVDDQEDDS